MKYYSTFIRQSHNKGKARWDIIKDETNIKDTNSLIHSVIVNNEEVFNPAKIAKQFNQYFAGIRSTNLNLNVRNNNKFL